MDKAENDKVLDIFSWDYGSPKRKKVLTTDTIRFAWALFHGRLNCENCLYRGVYATTYCNAWNARKNRWWFCPEWRRR